MQLKKLNLTNFRNYAKLELSLDDRPTIFIGDNAMGKSNILEAIYLLSTTKSHRSSQDAELILDENGFCRIEGIVADKSGETELMIIINRDEADVPFKKKVMVNGVSRRSVDFIGNLPAIIFFPSDINLVTGSPALRRWHLDLSLAQISKDYKRALTTYEHLLTSRNRVLKRIREGEGRMDELTFWTDGLLEQSALVVQKRQDFFDFTRSQVTPLGEFVFEYRPSLIDRNKLEQTIQREIASAATLIGPHRDDFGILLKKGIKLSDLSHFGSRGEQRTATLAFKLLQLEYMAQILNVRPMLLLDDVFSELDIEHRAHIIEIVSKQQTLIATVELEYIPKEFLDTARVMVVTNGVLSEK